MVDNNTIGDAVSWGGISVMFIALAVMGEWHETAVQIGFWEIVWAIGFMGFFFGMLIENN